MFRGYYSSHKAAGAIAQGLNAISAPATIEQPLKKKTYCNVPCDPLLLFLSSLPNASMDNA